MERTAAVAALFERAREIGRSLGMELTEGSTGGGSDGNFTAALGIPTLDRPRRRWAAVPTRKTNTFSWIPSPSGPPYSRHSSRLSR